MNNLNNLSEDIIAIELVFENCERIKVPINCFEQLNYQLNRDNNIINLDCIIKNDGSIDYVKVCDDHCYISPINRINQKNDIKCFNIIYKNGTKKCKDIDWYSTDDYYIPELNKNQKSTLLRYNKIRIFVKPYVPKYTLNQLFNFPSETVFKDEENNKYTMKLNSLGKYIDIPMTEKYINMKYTLCIDSKIERELISHYEQNNQKEVI